MGFFSRLLRNISTGGTRSNPVMPWRPPSLGQSTEYQSGYVLLTNKKDHDEQYLGRNLRFESHRGFLNRGEPETAILDGHTIWETQIRNTNSSKVREEFFDEFDMQILTRSQVSNIMAEEDDDPQMFGATAQMDQMMEDEMEGLREELEAEYVDKFEEDYQERFQQEYPAKFSKDYQEHYEDMVQDELDDVVDDHERLYEEYIVSDKHIRYKK